MENENISAAKQAKAAGLSGLSQISIMTGVSRETLRNWCINKPMLFRVVIVGCVAMSKNRRVDDQPG